MCQQNCMANGFGLLVLNFATMTSPKKTHVQGLCKHVTHEHAMTTQLHFLRISTPFVAQQDLHINKTNQTALTGEPHWAC